MSDLNENSVISRCKVPHEVPAEKLTTFRGGGSVRQLFVPSSVNDLLEICEHLRLKGETPFILGGGSNLIIADRGTDRAVISTKGLGGVHVVDGSIWADCGAPISSIIREGRLNSLGGLEFLSGVPATLGGVLRMNAGAFGAEIKDHVEEIYTLNADSGKIAVLKAEEIDFGYRKGTTDIVLGARLRLEHMSKEESLGRAKIFVAERRAKQPLQPSCGSVFKRADKPAGAYIDSAGLKGTACGGAEISKKHANFIVNNGGATATDFMTLVRLCEDTVYDTFGVELTREFIWLD